MKLKSNSKEKTHNQFEDILSIYKRMEPNLYKELEPKLLDIEPLFEKGILSKEQYQYFNNEFNQISFYISLLRKEYNQKFGFFLISEDFLNVSSEHFVNKKICEVGAGTGFLSKCFLDRKLDITPIDLKVKNNNYGFSQTFTDILEVNAIDYLKEKSTHYDTILMSWPNYDNDFAFNVLQQMNKGQELIYIGEGYGGCTGNDAFHELLQEKCSLDKNITNKFSSSSYSWPGIHDRVYVYNVIKD